MTALSRVIYICMLAARGPCNRDEDLTCVIQLGFESYTFRPIILAK